MILSSEKCVVMYLRLKYIDLATFYDFTNGTVPGAVICFVFRVIVSMVPLIYALTPVLTSIYRSCSSALNTIRHKQFHKNLQKTKVNICLVKCYY